MATMVSFFVLFTINIGKILTESDDLVFNVQDVLFTNSSSTYNAIPEYCNLFGSGFKKDNDVLLNITKNGTFWVGAKIEFRRSVNPLGVVYDCDLNSAGNITLDECIKKCESNAYLKHGLKSCICTDEDKITEGLISTQPCENEDMGMCPKSGKGCVVYKHVNKKDLSCETSYYYQKIIALVLETESKCTEKKNFGYICSKSKKPPADRNISWYDAFQLCQDDDDKLMQETVTIDEQLKDGSTYWISYFRRTVISWGKAENPILCVAATLCGNGEFSLRSKFCTEELPSLCHTKKPPMDENSEKKGERPNSSAIWIAVGCGLGVILVIILVAVIIKRSLKRRHKKIYIGEDDQRTSGQLYADTVASTTQSSEYFLCPTYSDPIHIKQMDSSGCKDIEYASVVKKAPQIITTQNKKEPENPYQIPEC